MVPPTSVANAQVHPLLGLPSPFPFLGAAAAGLSSLTDPKGQKGHGLHGLPPGFPNMMDIHSTQALLSLARSGSFLQPPVTSSGPPTTVAFSGLTEAKKRPNIVLGTILISRLFSVYQLSIYLLYYSNFRLCSRFVTSHLWRTQKGQNGGQIVKHSSGCLSSQLVCVRSLQFCRKHRHLQGIYRGKRPTFQNFKIVGIRKYPRSQQLFKMAPQMALFP